MPRKLKRISAKKPSNKSNPHTLAEAMEKDFKRIPAELPAQYGKDILALKQHEKKLSAKLKKMQKQKKAAKNKHSAAALKAKATGSSPVLKKKLALLKASYAQINQDIKALLEQLSELKETRKQLAIKQAKFITLNKLISKLDRQLDSKMKPAPKKSKKKLSKQAVNRKQKISSVTTKQQPSERMPVSRDNVSYDSNLVDQPETEEVN